MVGTQRYQDEQVVFILERHAQGMTYSKIAEAFRACFGIPDYNAKKAQYVVEHYGRDPKFGNSLHNRASTPRNTARRTAARAAAAAKSAREREKKKTAVPTIAAADASPAQGPAQQTPPPRCTACGGTGFAPPLLPAPVADVFARDWPGFAPGASPLTTPGLHGLPFIAARPNDAWAAVPFAGGPPVDTYHDGRGDAHVPGAAYAVNLQPAQGWPAGSGGDDVVAQAAAAYSRASAQPNFAENLGWFFQQGGQGESTGGSTWGIQIPAYCEPRAVTGDQIPSLPPPPPPPSELVGTQLKRPRERSELPLPAQRGGSHNCDPGFLPPTMNVEVKAEGADNYHSVPLTLADDAAIGMTHTWPYPWTGTAEYGCEAVGSGNGGVGEYAGGSASMCGTLGVTAAPDFNFEPPDHQGSYPGPGACAGPGPVPGPGSVLPLPIRSQRTLSFGQLQGRPQQQQQQDDHCPPLPPNPSKRARLLDTTEKSPSSPASSLCGNENAHSQPNVRAASPAGPSPPQMNSQSESSVPVSVPTLIPMPMLMPMTAGEESKVQAATSTPGTSNTSGYNEGSMDPEARGANDGGHGGDGGGEGHDDDDDVDLGQAHGWSEGGNSGDDDFVLLPTPPSAPSSSRAETSLDLSGGPD